MIMRKLMKRYLLNFKLFKFRLEIKEFSFDEESYYKILEKGYILGIRFYTDEYSRKYYVLANAIAEAKRIYHKLEEENLVGLNGTKTVWTLE